MICNLKWRSIWEHITAASQKAQHGSEREVATAPLAGFTRIACAPLDC
jgi:hypothetical protein